MPADIELVSPTRSASPLRFREKQKEGKESAGRIIENAAILLVNDALHMETDDYYIDDVDGKVKTIWQSGDYAREMGIWLRGDGVSITLGWLAIIDLILLICSPPLVTGAAATLVTVLHYMIWLVFCGHLALRLKFMSDAREHWLKGAAGPPWDCVQAFVLYVLVPIKIISDIAVPSQSFGQYDGTEMLCPAPLTSFLEGWTRAWVLIYVFDGIRKALTTLIVVITTLGPFFGLFCAAFLAHFFIFQSLAADQPVQNGFGVGGDVGLALYNLFGLMTTVNHPDVFMALTDVKPITFAFIVSYMFFTAILANNLLLGVVYGEYCANLDNKLTEAAELRLAMIDAAFELVTDPDDNIDDDQQDMNPEELLYILRQCDSYETPLDLPDGDRLMMICRMVDNKALTRSDILTDGGLQDRSIDLADFRELLVLYNIPYIPMSLTKTEHRFLLHLELLEKRLEDAPHHSARKLVRDEIKNMCSMTARQWAAIFPGFYYFAFIFGARQRYMSWSPWFERSALSQFHTIFFLIFLLYSIVDSDNTLITETRSAMIIMAVIVQSFCFVITFLADIRKWEPFHFFNPKSNTVMENYICAGDLFSYIFATFHVS